MRRRRGGLRSRLSMMGRTAEKKGCRLYIDIETHLLSTSNLDFRVFFFECLNKDEDLMMRRGHVILLAPSNHPTFRWYESKKLSKVCAYIQSIDPFPTTSFSCSKRDG